jgi:hypothetical protein
VFPVRYELNFHLSRNEQDVPDWSEFLLAHNSVQCCIDI